MKVVILAGGFGTRIAEESDFRPKPMIEIGGYPIIWHIMKIYAHYGFKEFIICLGYKGYMIKEYFINYYLHNSDVTINLSDNDIEIHQSNAEKFKVSLVDTGLYTSTAGRIQRVKEHIGNNRFMLTYGDGVSNLNIAKLVDFHEKSGKYATMTTIQPPGRFGSLDIDKNGQITKFVEKPFGESGWINGGFFVLEPLIFDYLTENADKTMWEDRPLQSLAAEGQLMSFKHSGFWHCMDHLRDKLALEKMWRDHQAPWKLWE